MVLNCNLHNNASGGCRNEVLGCVMCHSSRPILYLPTLSVLNYIVKLNLILYDLAPWECSECVQFDQVLDSVDIFLRRNNSYVLSLAPGWP